MLSITAEPRQTSNPLALLVAPLAGIALLTAAAAVIIISHQSHLHPNFLLVVLTAAAAVLVFLSFGKLFFPQLFTFGQRTV